MGVLLIDGFDHYTGLPGKWSNWGGSGYTGIGAGGRWSSNAYKIWWYDSGVFLTKAVPNLATYYFGTAFYTALIYGSSVPIAGFWDGSSTQVAVYLKSDGTIGAMRGNFPGGTELGASTNIYPTTAYHYVETMATIDSSGGVVEVHVDGVEWLHLTGKNTQATSNPYANIVGLPGHTAGYGCDVRFDDIYIADDAFKGDCRVETRMPTGAGYYTGWTATAAPNWECVNETPPVTSDYVYATAAGTTDTYTKAALSTTVGDVLAVAVNLYSQKAEGGARTIDYAARLSSVDGEGAGASPASSWAYMQRFVSRPGGGSWSITDVNNAELGVKIIS